MFKVNFFHVCEKAIIEQGTGNISIISIFENLNANKFPALHPQMFIVAGFEAEKVGPYDVELIFLDEEAEILKITAKINIGANLKGNWVHKISLYTIPRDKTQKIKLNHKGETIYTSYLTVNNK